MRIIDFNNTNKKLNRHFLFLDTPTEMITLFHKNQQQDASDFLMFLLFEIKNDILQYYHINNIIKNNINQTTFIDRLFGILM